MPVRRKVERWLAEKAFRKQRLWRLRRKHTAAVKERKALLAENEALERDIERWRDKLETRKLRGALAQKLLSPTRADAKIAGLNNAMDLTDKSIVHQERVIESLRKRIERLEALHSPEKMELLRNAERTLSAAETEFRDLKAKGIALREQVTELQKAREELETNIAETDAALEKRKEEGLVADDSRLTRAKAWFLQNYYKRRYGVHSGRALSQAGIRGDLGYLYRAFEDLETKWGSSRDPFFRDAYFSEWSYYFRRGVNESVLLTREQKIELTERVLTHVASKIVNAECLSDYFSSYTLGEVNLKKVVGELLITDERKKAMVKTVVTTYVEHALDEVGYIDYYASLHNIAHIVEKFPEEAMALRERIVPGVANVLNEMKREGGSREAVDEYNKIRAFYLTQPGEPQLIEARSAERVPAAAQAAAAPAPREAPREAPGSAPKEAPKAAPKEDQREAPRSAPSGGGRAAPFGGQALPESFLDKYRRHYRRYKRMYEGGSSDEVEAQAPQGRTHSFREKAYRSANTAKHWFLQKWYHHTELWYHHTELRLKAAHHAGVRGNFKYVRDFARKSSYMEDIVQITDSYLKGVNESRFFELHEKRALTIDALLFVAQYGEPDYLSGRIMESINVREVLRFVCETEGQRNEDTRVIVGKLIEHCGNKWLNRSPYRLLSDLVTVIEGFPEEARQHEGMIMHLAEATESKLRAQRDFTEYNARGLRQLKTFFSTRT